MRTLLTVAVFGVVVMFSFASKAQQANEPEIGGVAKVSRAIVFDVPLKKLVRVIQENQDDLIESQNNKIVKREGDTITIEIGLPFGLVTNITLRQQKGVGENGEAFFRSSIIKTDGFLTKQDVVIRVKERGGKTVAETHIAAQAPEVQTSLVRAEIIKVMDMIERKMKGYLAEK